MNMNVAFLPAGKEMHSRFHVVPDLEIDKARENYRKFWKYFRNISEKFGNISGPDPSELFRKYFQNLLKNFRLFNLYSKTGGVTPRGADRRAVRYGIPIVCVPRELQLGVNHSYDVCPDRHVGMTRPAQPR